MNKISGKPKTKLSVLDKTALDWKNFKEKEGISEELATFNKGKGGFLEKQKFLQQSDYKQYEAERNIRMGKRWLALDGNISCCCDVLFNDDVIDDAYCIRSCFYIIFSNVGFDFVATQTELFNKESLCIFNIWHHRCWSRLPTAALSGPPSALEFCTLFNIINIIILTRICWKDRIFFGFLYMRFLCLVGWTKYSATLPRYSLRYDHMTKDVLLLSVQKI